MNGFKMKIKTYLDYKMMKLWHTPIYENLQIIIILDWMQIGVYCGLSTASEVFLIFITQLYLYFSVFFLFVLFSDEPKVFLPKYSQTAIKKSVLNPRNLGLNLITMALLSKDKGNILIYLV